VSISSQFILFVLFCNCIGVVMVSILTSHAVDNGFKPRSSQTKDYEIVVGCSSTKYTLLRSKSKDWLAKNHDYVS
jgi:hypothetical protein